MMKDHLCEEGIDKPVNMTDRYLYGINMRLDALCHMLSSVIDFIATQNGVATTSNTNTLADVEVPLRSDSTESERVYMETELGEMTSAELKGILASKELPTTGKKVDLVNRLVGMPV